MLATASVDVIVSHMALMLMAPLDEVIREMHRVLRPGGMLAAVVGSDQQDRCTNALGPEQCRDPARQF